MAFVTSVMLASCASGVTLVRSQSAASYYSYHGNQLPIVVHGNPFSGAKADFDQIAADAAQARLRHPTIALTLHDGSTPLPEFYVVLAFNAPRSQSPSGLCDPDGGGIPTASNDGQLKLLAAVCRGSDAIGWAIASANEVDGVASPSLHTLISQTAAATLQVQPSFRRHGDGGNR